MGQQHGPEWIEKWEAATVGRSLHHPYHHLGEGGEDGEDGEDAPLRTHLKLRRLTDMRTPPPTRWLGTGFVPRSEITVLVGDEGIGKSLAWVSVAAAVTTGQPFAPFNIPAREPADVVLVITEDSLGEVQARLQVAGADLSRVLVYSHDDDGTGSPTFGNTTKDGAFLDLDGWLHNDDVNPSLLVVDAWLDTVQGNLNVRDTQQARQALHPWKTIAARHDLAVVLLTHTNRIDTGDTRTKMGATAALRQKARMVLFATKPPAEGEDDTRRRLVIGPEKSNVTGLANALAFDVDVVQVRPATDDDPGTTARITNAEDMGAPVGDLFGKWHQETRETRGGDEDKLEPARMVLRAYMQNRESANPSDVKQHLRVNGVSRRNAEAVMKELGKSSNVGPDWFYRLNASDD
ncbi:AAA family ATPase [Kocuria rosea]|uniref:AAA family ATPase n=1 Tax=Kocuria rosea TaxID=1275 RepID=UPI00203AF21B|nr:AAA family ATPase [Kocuria rosea]